MQRYRQARPLMEADIAEELVALDVNRDLCFGFNEPATIIWKMLESPKNSAELVDQLTTSFDVERSVCEADVSELLAELQRHGLVEPA